MTLPPDVDEQLSAALAAELAKVTRDERAAFDVPSRNSAANGRKLYAVHVRLAGVARVNGDLAAAQRVHGFIAEEVKLPSMVVREAARRTVAGAVVEVGTGMAKDAAAGAAQLGGGLLTVGRFAPLIVAAVLALVVWQLARKVLP